MLRFGMRLFNLDMHISIAHDVKHIFQNLGHQIDSVNLSGHTWVNNEKRGKNKVVTQNNWKEIDEDLCNQFYHKYKKKFKDYDGFIHSYPPAFALLFEKFEKPIITIACTRFDYPVKVENLPWLVEGLQRIHKGGQLVPVANNLLDKYYCEQWLGFTWKHITSLCDYLEVKYRPERPDYIAWHRAKLDEVGIKKVDLNFSIRKKYDRNEISKYLGVIHFPYNLSIMSAFEQYFQNIPLFFPSIEFQAQLYEERNDMLGEVLFEGSPLKFSPNLIKLADWYDPQNMAETILFDSFDHLDELLTVSDLQSISNSMREFNSRRQSNVYTAWAQVLEEIK